MKVYSLPLENVIHKVSKVRRGNSFFLKQTNKKNHNHPPPDLGSCSKTFSKLTHTSHYRIWFQFQRNNWNQTSLSLCPVLPHYCSTQNKSFARKMISRLQIIEGNTYEHHITKAFVSRRTRVLLGDFMRLQAQQQSCDKKKIILDTVSNSLQDEYCHTLTSSRKDLSKCCYWHLHLLYFFFFTRIWDKKKAQGHLVIYEREIN